MSQPSAQSVGVDKALVFDEERGHYTLMSRDMAKIKVMKHKPGDLRAYALQALYLVGVMAIGAILYRGVSDVVVRTDTLVAEGVQTAPEPAVAVSSVAPVPMASASIPVPVPASASVPPVSKAAAPAPVVAPSPVTPVPPPVHQAVVPKKPVVVTAKPLVTTPQRAPLARAAADLSPLEARGSDPGPTVAPAPRGWALRVEAAGVIFFDGQSSRLYRIGETIPNGEKIIDVDPGSATYATDRGVRQIRSSQLSTQRSSKP